MESISEPKFMSVLFRIIPPFICVTQYFMTVVMALMIMLVDCSWEIRGLIVLIVLVGLVMIPFWYKTFFDRQFVGPDRPIAVQWFCDQISFRGAYFNVKVPAANILQYKAIGFKKWETAFILKLKVKMPNGSASNMYLSTTMPRKKLFLSFLEKEPTNIRG